MSSGDARVGGAVPWSGIKPQYPPVALSRQEAMLEVAPRNLIDPSQFIPNRPATANDGRLTSALITSNGS